MALVADSTGKYPFDPEALPYVIAYVNGFPVTDTRTNGALTWVKTFTNNGTNITGASMWVKQ